MDIVELALISKTKEIVERRITNMNISIEYHKCILQNKMDRLKKEKEYRNVLKERNNFIVRNQ